MPPTNAPAAGGLAAPASPKDSSPGTLSYDLKSGLALDWYYDNAEVLWHNQEGSYFRDFSGDGKPDYFMVQRHSTSGQMRLFCFGTANSAVAKTYLTDRVAWREYSPVEGTFVPRSVRLVKPEAATRAPDIVIWGRNSAATTYNRFIFYRLDETATTFPNEATWSVTVDSALLPQVAWIHDCNGDAYPDFLVYNQKLNASSQFVVTCYNGLTGALVWTRALDKDAADPNTEGFGGGSRISVMPLGNSASLGSADFSGDSTRDLLVSYSYGYMSMVTFEFGVHGSVRVLSGATGSPLPAFTDWWTLYDVTPAFVPASVSPAFDFDGDGWQDISVLSFSGVTGDLPLYRAVDLHDKTVLFETNSADFGAAPEDQAGYLPVQVLDSGEPADLNGDAWWDLVFSRYYSAGPEQPLAYGLFNAYANGAATKGRKVWLSTVPAPYDQVSMNVNDWDGNGVLDPLLIANPAAPTITKGYAAPWALAMQNLGATAPTGLRKTFTYAIAHSGTWSAATDSFGVQPAMAQGFGDIDGDGQLDTAVSVGCSFDYGDNGTDDVVYANHVFLDNTPGAAAPAITAEMAITLTGGSTDIWGLTTPASNPWTGAAVDQNGDGLPNDIITSSERAIFALSFTTSSGGGTVAAPTFAPPAPQTFATSLNVAISCSTVAATIRYTTNGTDPTSSSTVYSAGTPLTLTETTVLKARAFKSGLTDSAVTTGTYTKVIETVAAPTFAPPAPQTFATSLNVAISCSTAAATIRYTTNGIDPTASSTVYSTGTPVTLTETTVLKARAFKSGWTDSPVTSGTYTRETPSAVSRTITSNGTVSPHVSLLAAPAVSVNSYSVEEVLPAGLTASGITGGGTWNAGARKVQWGPFADHGVRTLAYDVTGLAGPYTLNGKGTFGGTDTATTGDSSLVLGDGTEVTVTFAAGAHGHVNGTTVQTIPRGGSTTPVTAVGDHGYVFDRWSDTSTTNPRTLTNVTTTQTVTASFRLANQVPPNGTFVAVVDAAAVAAGRGIWDVSGVYSTSVGGNPLTLTIVHDSRGKLSGTGTYTVGATVVTMPIRGQAKGSGGTALLTFVLQGTDAAQTVRAALSFRLTVAVVSRQLTGTMSGSVQIGAVVTPVSAPVALHLVPPMDGTWTLRFELTRSRATLTGTALLTLSNLVHYPYTVTGRFSGTTAVLTLTADPSDPPAKAITVWAKVVTLEGGWATLQNLSARGHGQTLTW